mmetsp:Transcript_3330/g.6744  ORF Transcript_3330/g.6744 Transcript_3330/m.6744 type:complete len:523 (+) Transcript_3330:1-1569(+)
MTENLLSGDCACHHVVVQKAKGKCGHVLSSLDLVHALCHLESAPDASLRPSGKEPPHTEAAHVIEELTVWNVMKRRNDIFTCSPSGAIKDALKTMLLSGQNSTLIVDDQGVSGIITPRDILRAFVDGVPSRCPIADLDPSVMDRIIESHVRVASALQMMRERNLNHLVVVRSHTAEVVGMLSSLNVVLSAKARSTRLHSLQVAVGPEVGELVARHRHFTAVCSTEETLASAAKLLMASSRTAAVVRDRAGAPLGLLTENDIARAFCEGAPPGALIDDWFSAQGSLSQRAQPHLVIRPSVQVTEAATLMVLMQSAADGGRGPCHHLVVQGSDGEWLGILSALDVARGVRSLRSELELARTSADKTNVSDIMKRTVPKCKPSDTIQEALSAMMTSRQNCVLVEDEGGFYGVVTPRCAVQAFVLGTPLDARVDTCLKDVEHRRIKPTSRLVDAAQAMATHCVHHLVVTASEGGSMLGVVSSLDVVRGVATINSQCPFVSLRWLGLCKGRECCMLHRAERASASLG